MKKLLVSAIAAATLLAAPCAQAQDSQMFNHMSLGVTVGLLDGFGLDLAMPVGPSIQLRAGYAIDPIPINASLDLGTYTSGDKTFNLNGIGVKANTWKSGNGHLMADFYPSRTGSFHLSAGVFVNNGKLVSASADLSKVLDKGDWGTLAIGPEGGFTVSTDPQGQLLVDVKTWAAMPYLGLGFGRAVDRQQRFRFVFDMGLLIWGGLKIQSYDYVDNSFNSSKPVKTVALDGDALRSYNAQAADILDAVSSLPLCPYMRFGFYFRLF